MRYILIAVLMLSTAAGICQSETSLIEKPGFWMMPSPWPNNGGPLKELITRDNAWIKTREVIDGVGYWPALLNIHFTDDEIEMLFTKLKKWNLKFGFEVPVIKNNSPTADASIAILDQQMSRFKPLGADVSWFAFDEPFYASKHVLVKPDSYAVDETAKFIKMLRERYPDAMIGDIEPYPVLKLEELKSFVASLNNKCIELGTKGIDFLRLDVDWCSMNNNYDGSWREVKALENFLHENNIKFSLIYWAADQPLLENINAADDMTWYIGVMHQGYAYLIAGGKPDEYVIESWVQVPKRAVPERMKSTFTGSVIDFYNRFIKGR